MKKLKEAALKTGLGKDRVNSVFSFSIVALIVSFFSSCAKNTVSISSTNQSVTVKPMETNSSSADVILDTGTVLDKKSCGPTPNYPCGTRYYTVSIDDFDLTAGKRNS